MKFLLYFLLVGSVSMYASQSPLQRARTPLRIKPTSCPDTTDFGRGIMNTPPPSATAVCDIDAGSKVSSSEFVDTMNTEENIYDLTRSECVKRVSGSPHHELVVRHLEEVLQLDQGSPDFNSQNVCRGMMRVRSGDINNAGSDYITSVVSRAFQLALKDLNDQLETKKIESESQFTKCQSFTLALISSLVSGGIAVAAAINGKSC